MNIIKYILWWEIRRLLFNLFLLGSTLVLCFAFGFNLFRTEPGSGAYYLFITYLLLIALANLVYTLNYFIYYKKAKENKTRIGLFERIMLCSLILLTLYTIFILVIILYLFQ
ncbi:MAG: hypothetical protein ABS67_03885 [Niabella sp. SCN 42-15]|nr:MAG: hypothetical protein ABS67_03885 [Niabella sp. SCN 42-15]OJV52855.1 MAG: hypothetical protein BGO31_03625 [Bacteroidetes bacterium 43-16]